MKIKIINEQSNGGDNGDVKVTAGGSDTVLKPGDSGTFDVTPEAPVQVTGANQ